MRGRIKSPDLAEIWCSPLKSAEKPSLKILLSKFLWKLCFETAALDATPHAQSHTHAHML